MVARVHNIDGKFYLKPPPEANGFYDGQPVEVTILSGLDEPHLKRGTSLLLKVSNPTSGLNLSIGTPIEN
jgi:hypothetical protein